MDRNLHVYGLREEGEYANSTQKGRRSDWDSNPRPCCCEATALTTKRTSETGHPTEVKQASKAREDTLHRLTVYSYKMSRRLGADGQMSQMLLNFNAFGICTHKSKAQVWVA